MAEAAEMVRVLKRHWQTPGSPTTQDSSEGLFVFQSGLKLLISNPISCSTQDQLEIC